MKVVNIFQKAKGQPQDIFCFIFYQCQLGIAFTEAAIRGVLCKKVLLEI